jgi:hypothetical protein
MSGITETESTSTIPGKQREFEAWLSFKDFFLRTLKLVAVQLGFQWPCDSIQSPLVWVAEKLELTCTNRLSESFLLTQDNCGMWNGETVLTLDFIYCLDVLVNYLQHHRQILSPTWYSAWREVVVAKFAITNTLTRYTITQNYPIQQVPNQLIVHNNHPTPARVQLQLATR